MTSDEPGVLPPPDYPWYRTVSDKSMEQGDLLFNFPSVTVTSTYDQITSEEVYFDLAYYDAILLSQSCDLAVGKIENVILCPVFSREELAPKVKGLESSKSETQIQNGKWPSLYLLPPCRVKVLDLETRIVNFRQVLTVPIEVLADHLMHQEPRVRLSPPYREHLAQAFARFIMRIGFPLDFRT